MERETDPVVIQLSLESHAEVIELWQRSGLHIRPGGRDSPEAFARQMATGVQTLFGIRGEKGLVAVVFATHDGRKGWINRLAVDPTYRRRGLALRLIRACEEHFLAMGIEVWAVLIEEWNEASLALFRKAGYTLADNITYASRRTRSDA